jgi:hypothetical protein
MKDQYVAPASQSTADDLGSQWHRMIRRRSFLKGLGLVGAGTALPALTAIDAGAAGTSLTPGDTAILQLLAALEIIEADLWSQYRELGGVDGGNPAYRAALANIDGDMPQYISDNTDDELSHARFLNAYLVARGAAPVNLGAFHTLPGSRATGSSGKRRLTNLLHLNVDTSWYTRYRSHRNPDFGATFPQAVTIKGEPTVPLDDTDTPPGTAQPVPPDTDAARRMQAIANAAAFHFATVEQGGASLYTYLSLKVTSPEVLRILVSIGGVEVNHFAIWHDKAGSAVSQPLAGVTDPETGVTFPDLNNPGGPDLQTNLILPEPCDFISTDLPDCSVIRPSGEDSAGAVKTLSAISASRIFEGQPSDFFDMIFDLGEAADAAHRQ